MSFGETSAQAQLAAIVLDMVEVTSKLVDDLAENHAPLEG